MADRLRGGTTIGGYLAYHKGNMDELTVTNSSITGVPLTVNGITATTANLQEWLVNDVQKAKIGANGTVYGNAFYSISGTYFLNPGDAGTSLHVAGDIQLLRGKSYYAGEVELMTSVDGANYLKTGSTLYVQNGSTTLMTLDGSGNLGIGTAPARKLHLAGGILAIDNTGGYSGFEGWQDGVWEMYIGTESDAPNIRYNSKAGAHTWYKSGVVAMKLTTGGNLGIGVESPAEKLEINGNIKLHEGTGSCTMDYNNTTKSMDFIFN